ncbi:MAG: zinc-ribbon domain-containing protein [Myxococcota bacterium]
MIVTCEECSTSFQLDEARIPASGARVRCSRCKHAFFLANPTASASQAVHAVVEEVVKGPAGRAPSPAQDLAHPNPPERAVRPGRSEPEEEESWEFSQEIRIAGDDEPDEAEDGGASPRPDSFDLTGDFGRGFDPDTFDRDETETPTLDRPASGSDVDGRLAREREEATFGTVEDFSSMIDDEDIAIDVDTERSSTRAPAASAGARPAVNAKGPSADDLGEPESWDLVGGEDSRQAGARVAALARPTAAQRKPALDLFEESELPSIRDDVGTVGRWTATRWAAVGRVLGWGVALAGIALVAGLLGQVEWSRWAGTPQRLELGPLVASTTRAGWVDTSRAGLLLVFEGELHNSGVTPIPAVPLQLRLLDGAGMPLPAPAIEAGLPLTDRALRESTPERLVAERSRAITRWGGGRMLAPGERRPFVAIALAEALPADARRFVLEAGTAAAASGLAAQRPSESLP